VPRGLYLSAGGSNERQAKYTWAPSGWWTWAVRTDNCATRFSEKSMEKSFLFKDFVRTVSGHRPDGRTSAASNFLIRHSSVRTLGMIVRTAILQHAISISVMCASGRLKSNQQFPSLMHPRPDHSCQTSGRSYLNCDSCLTETSVRTGYHIVRTVD
jgi:hypothetical protein